jgi:hypothetical protein
MSAYTPGPWIIDEPHQVWAESAREYVATTQIEDWETIPREQAEANAKLIAAAPDLVLALQHIASNAAESPEWIRRVAREAIAKATGGAP